MVHKKKTRSKLYKNKPSSKQTLRNVQSAIVVALKLLKPVVNRKLPKAHFNYEVEERNEKK